MSSSCSEGTDSRWNQELKRPFFRGGVRAICRLMACALNSWSLRGAGSGSCLERRQQINKQITTIIATIPPTVAPSITGVLFGLSFVTTVTLAGTPVAVVTSVGLTVVRESMAVVSVEPKVVGDEIVAPPVETVAELAVVLQKYQQAY